MKTFTSRERRYVWIFAVITFVSRLALGLRGEANQASRLFKDDSFYMMSCVWHLAQGHGLTVDGIHPTNGIQPLFVFLDVPFFWLAHGDRWLGVQLTFIPLAIFSAVSVILAARIMLKIQRHSSTDDSDKIWRNPVIVVAALWTLAYPMLDQMMNGLETGLYSMMLLWCILLYVEIEFALVRSIRSFVVLGVVLGVLVLSRIDAVFFVAAITIIEVVRFRLDGLKRAVAAGFVAIVVSAPWFIFNYIGFGSVMPISGQSESIGAVPVAENLQHAGRVLADIVSVVVFLPYNSPHWMWTLWTVGILLTLGLIATRLHLIRKLSGLIRLDILIPFAVAACLLASYYIVFFHAAYFLDRYFQPIRILWSFLVAALIANVHWATSRRIVRNCGFAFVSVGLFYFSAHFVHNFTATWVADLYEAGLWSKAHAGARVGMCQSGVSGFTADNVWNLDGKVNPDVLLAIKTHHIGAYLDSTHMDYLADWGVGIEHVIADAGMKQKYRLVDSIKLVRIYQRVE